MANLIAQFEEFQHPRAPAGSPEGGQFVEKPDITEIPEPESQTFVSPNVGQLTFAQAQAEVNGERQKILNKVSGDIDRRFDIKSGTTRNVIGAWTDGAENSLVVTMPGVPFGEAKVITAMKGWLADQKSVLVFEPRTEGEHFMATFPVTDKFDTLHSNLLSDGLTNHTLEPTQDGAIVHVFGMDQATADAVNKAAGRYGTKAKVIRGYGEFVGTSKEDGTDAEQRADAKRVYENLFRGKLRGRDVAETWNDIRDRWGRALQEVSAVTPEQSAAVKAQTKKVVTKVKKAYEAAAQVTGVDAVERSWDGMPFRVATGDKPEDTDTPPERTPEGDFVFYHGTSAKGVEAITLENRITPDDLGVVGVATIPGQAQVFASMKSKGGTRGAVLRIVVDKAWLGKQMVTREIGGSGHDQFLIRNPHGIPARNWHGIPREAIKGIKEYVFK